MSRAAATSVRLRRALVAELEARNCIVSPAVRRAVLAVPREAFLPEFVEAQGLEAVYRDAAVPTKRGADGLPTSSSSQPAIMALMLERLDVRPGQRVLEVGAGTGYNAALLGELVGAAGRVVTVELDDDVARGARRGLKVAGSRARVVVGDGHEAWERGAPYDRIVVTASSARVPREWRDQLVDGGLLEVPLRLRDSGPHAITTFQRRGARLESIAILCGGFMPLRGAATPGSAYTSLSVQSLSEGRRDELFELRGAGIAALARPARRRLLGLALGEPRRSRPLRLRGDSWALPLYLALQLPPRRVVESWSPLLVGVAGRDGRSLAAVTLAERCGRPASVRAVSFGGDEAEGLLDQVLERWEEAGRPTEAELRVRVTFRRDRSALRWRWLPRR